MNPPCASASCQQRCWWQLRPHVNAHGAVEQVMAARAQIIAGVSGNLIIFATCRLCQMGASPCDNRPSSLGQARARAASALDKQELRLHLRLRAAPEQLPMCQICVIWVYLFSLPAARQGTFCFCVVVLEELPQPLLLLLPLPSFVLLELEAPILHFLLPLPIAVFFRIGSFCICCRCFF